MGSETPRPEGEPATLPSLTPLRGLAALVVVIYHSAFFAANYAGGATPGVIRRGYLAVDLFFLLSGFVLAHVYRSRLGAAPGGPAIRRFLWARWCRIYPMNAFTAALLGLKYATGTLALPAGISFKTQFVAALLLMQVPWLDQVALNGPSWSVSAEFYAYLLFPFVVARLLRLRPAAAAAVFAALAGAVAINHVTPGQYHEVYGWAALARALPEFLIGVVAYRGYRGGMLGRVWAADATFATIVALLATGCLAGVSDAVIVSLLLALLLAAVGNRGHIVRLLNAAPLRWLGEISYSVYIFQIVPFTTLAALAPTLVAHGCSGVRFEMLAIVAAVACGALVHRCVDLPVRAALRRLPARLSGLAPSPAAAGSER